MTIKIQKNSDSYIDDFYQVQQKTASRWQRTSFPDIGLLIAIMFALALGALATSSATMNISLAADNSLLYGKKHLFHILFSFFAAYYVMTRKIHFYERNSKYFFWFSIFLMLLLLFFPALGEEIKGARRWINLGRFNLQTGEVLKLGLLLYLANYLSINEKKIQKKPWETSISLLLICFFSLFLLAIQPDYGTAILLLGIVLIQLYLANLKARIFWIYCFFGIFLAIVGILIEPYRASRFFETFLDPWKNYQNGGYQLVNSLVAFANGGSDGSSSITGLGLGQSIQKHKYLPEAHNDFIYAIISEEFGFLGALLVLFIYLFILWRAIIIAERAKKVRRIFASYYAYGAGLIISLQAFLHIGVNCGLLPTKGINLPLISHGGSSMLISCLILAILLRVDMETRWQIENERKL